MMYSKFFEMFQDMSSASMAKTEALQARAVFVNGVLQQSYRLWLTLLTTEVTEAVRAARELSQCRSPADIAEVQRAWFMASSSRAVASLQGVVEIANFLIGDLNKAMATMGEPLAQPTAAPAPAPVALPPPPPRIALPESTPVAAVSAPPPPAPPPAAPAPTAEVAKPAAKPAKPRKSPPSKPGAAR